MLVFPFYILAMRGWGARTTETSRQVQEATEVLSGEVQERVSNIHVVKIFRAEKREVRRFFGSARRLFDLTMANVRVSALSNSVVQWLTQMATLGMIWYGGSRLYHGYTNSGTVVAFTYLIARAYLPVNRISEMNTILHNSLAAIDRIFELFDMQPDVREKPDAIRLKRACRAAITLQNVTFSYPAFSEPAAKANGDSVDDLEIVNETKMRQTVLHDISLSIARAKSSRSSGHPAPANPRSMQLIPRFYDPQSGQILIDGHDVKDLNLRNAAIADRNGRAGNAALLRHRPRKSAYGRPDATEKEMSKPPSPLASTNSSPLPDGYETRAGRTRGKTVRRAKAARRHRAGVFVRSADFDSG